MNSQSGCQVVLTVFTIGGVGEGEERETEINT